MKYSELAIGSRLKIDNNEAACAGFAKRECIKLDNNTFFYRVNTPFSQNYHSCDVGYVSSFGDARYKTSEPFLATQTKDSRFIKSLHPKIIKILVPQTFTCITPPRFIRSEGHSYEVTAYAQLPSLSMLDPEETSIEGEYNADLRKYVSVALTRTPRDAHLVNYFEFGVVKPRQAYRNCVMPLIFKIDGDFTVTESTVSQWDRTPLFTVTSDPPKYYSFPEFKTLFARSAGGAE